MRIENRLTSIERELGVGQNRRPFVLIVSAESGEESLER